jgi:hypothetical protein
MAIGMRRAVLPALTGGCNYTNNTLTIESNQAQQVINCHIDESGIAYTRKGSDKLNAAALPAAITSIYEFRRPYGSGTASTILVTAGLKLYYWDTGTSAFVEITSLSSTDKPCWDTFQDENAVSFAVMCNGSDFFKYNGTDLTNVSTDYPWNSGAPRYILVYDDRMLATGCDSDPYKVFVSAIFDCTDWKPGTSTTAVYWTVKSHAGNRITGLGKAYDYCAIFQQFGVTIITEADPDSATSKQIAVSSKYGTTSHWSIQSVGNDLYFADESHIYKGVLREAVENGLVVTPIDKNIIEKYKTILNKDSIVSVYDSANKEIQWAGRAGLGSYNDLTLVFNIGLTEQNQTGENIWSGWFEGTGYEPQELASVVDSGGENKVYRGDSDGYVWEMDKSTVYKDGTEDIETTIYLAPFKPYGLGINKRARTFIPLLYQKYDNATTVRWIVDGRYTDTAVQVDNNVALWRPVSGVTTMWDGSIWTDKPIVIQPMSILEPFIYIQFVIYNDGSEAADEIAWLGAELYYQVHTVSGARKVG